MEGSSSELKLVKDESAPKKRGRPRKKIAPPPSTPTGMIPGEPPPPLSSPIPFLNDRLKNIKMIYVNIPNDIDWLVNNSFEIYFPWLRRLGERHVPQCLLQDAQTPQDKLIVVNWWRQHTGDQQKDLIEELKKTYRAPTRCNDLYKGPAVDIVRARKAKARAEKVKAQEVFKISKEIEQEGRRVQSRTVKIEGVEPRSTSGPLNLDKAALLMIDFQRDFLLKNGFGDRLGQDISKLEKAVAPAMAVLEQCRRVKMLIIHTREGHRPDLMDLHPRKRQRTKNIIGKKGQMGRILVRGEESHNFIPELEPQKGEAVIDKPGKGSFYATDLEATLHAQGIRTLLVCGVTTEASVQTTVREASDRGFHCIVIKDACASYRDDFHEQALAMMIASNGLFGSSIDSHAVIQAINKVETDKQDVATLKDAPNKSDKS